MRNPLAYQFPPKLGPVDHVPWMPDGRCSLMAMRAVMAASGRGAAYIIPQSIRFNDDDSAYMYRTPSGAGNRKTWTWSGWIKRDANSNNQVLFNATNNVSTSQWLIRFASSKLGVQGYDGSVYYNMISTAVYRDPSAWYHFVVAFDTTEATSSNRIKVWVNGVEITSWGTEVYPSLNYDGQINNTVVHQIGFGEWATQRYNGYLADVHFIDGAALTAASFGEFDTNGVWVPIAYAGTDTTTDFIPAATGTTIGDMTSGGGIAAAFDGDTSQTRLTGAWVISSGSPAYIGKDYSVEGGFTATKVVVFASTDAGFNNDGNTSRRLVMSLEGSATGAWAGEEVELDANVFGDNGFTAYNNATLTLTPATPANYDYYRVLYTETTANYVEPCAAEVQFFEESTGYGTNGFYITGENSAALGTDYSGNSNTFTTSGLTTADQMLDSPTDDAANGVGNYCTWNAATGAPNWTFANGNLSATGIVESNHRRVAGTFGVSTGKWYWEVTTAVAPYIDSIGVISLDAEKDGVIGYLPSYGAGWGYSSTVGRWDAGAGWASVAPAPGALPSSGVLGFAMDLDNNKLWIRDASGWVNSGDPAAGTTPNFTHTGDLRNFTPGLSKYYNTGTYTLNCGQETYAYTPPTGFENLCTANLPAPAIPDGSAYFQTKIFTGTGASNALVLGGNSVMQPDLVWIKNRDNAYSHGLFDAVRGTGLALFSDQTTAEYTSSSVTSFDTDGFTVGTDLTWNENTKNHVAWNWKANASAGFFIGTGTGTGGQVATNHDLGVTPNMVMWKARSGLSNWFVWSDTFASLTDHTLFLNTTAATATTGYGSLYGTINSTSASILTGGVTNGIDNGETFVMYAFANVEGYSKFGKYTGNGSADGPFVNCGFRPAFILSKNTATTVNWRIHDNARTPGNISTSNTLFPDTTAAEGTTEPIDFLSNGFKIRVNNTALNGSGNTIIYAAFAEHPFGGAGVSQARAR